MNRSEQTYKIVFIIHSLGIGGMEKVMSILIRNFPHLYKCEIHILLIGRDRKIYQNIPNSVIVHKPLWEFESKKRLWHTLKTIIFVRKVLKRIKPDSILSFGEYWNNLVLLSTIRLKIPIFVSDRSSPAKNLGLLHSNLRKLLYPLATGYIAQTKVAGLIAKKRKYNSNINVIGNPVEQIEASYSKNSSNVMLTVGRLIKTKNIDRLIYIFKNANEESNWTLKIVGGSPSGFNSLESYKVLVENLGLNRSVELLGQRSNTMKYFNECSIFVFTSSSEGFPNALAEAMSAGCACIAYDCVAGPSDMIEDGVNGFLVPLHNEQLFIKKLMMLMNNPDLRLKFGIRARKKMKEYSSREISKKYYNVISVSKEINITSNSNYE